MSKRLNKVRKELEMRRRQIDYNVKKRERTAPMLMNRHEEDRGEFDFLDQKEDHRFDAPNVKSRDFFLFRMLASVCLFLIIAILFRSNVPQLDGVKQFVVQSYEQEFQFAEIANWYEEQFGRPLALVPIQQDVAQGDPNEQVEMAYAMPAAGVIREGFEQTGRGILVETGMDVEVEAVKGGYVIAVGGGDEESLGKTVTVQHYDGTESLYGMLDEITVNIYDHIQAGNKIGTVSTNQEAEKGIFYFALKKDDDYINPSEVLPFD